MQALDVRVAEILAERAVQRAEEIDLVVNFTKVRPPEGALEALLWCRGPQGGVGIGAQLPVRGLQLLSDTTGFPVEGSFEFRVVLDGFEEEAGSVPVYDVEPLLEVLLGGKDKLAPYAELPDGEREGSVEGENPFEDQNTLQDFDAGCPPDVWRVDL